MIEQAEQSPPQATPTGAIGRIAVGDIARRTARRYPAGLALVDGDVRLTFAELDARANQFGNYLLSRGLRKGDRVVALSENSYRFVIAMLGTHKAGLVWVPVNVGLAPGDIAYIVGHAEPRAAYVGDAVYANDEARAFVTSAFGTVVVASAPPQAAPNVTGLDDAIADQSADEPGVDIGERDIIQIMYTSGTTGRPKGVMHSHVPIYIATLGNIIEGRWRPGAVVPAVLPMFHVAQQAITLTALHVGATTVVLRGFDPGALLRVIEAERATHLVALPLMYAAMLDHPERPARDLSSLELCIYGMAPMPEPLLRRAIAEFCPNFSLASGQTEMYPGTTMFRPEEQLRRFGCYWGDSAIVNDTAIMDDEGNLLAPGQVGEIVHRGPNVMEGYYKDPEATERSRAFGWHHTGDLGLIDPDGQLLFVDRKKDMIKTGGENVPSIKVETALLSHPAVANAAAVGIGHRRWSEAVTGFVVLKPGCAAGADELIEHCKERLGGFEVPKAIVFLDALPLTSTGKVQKHALRDKHADLYASDDS